jgi:hypothetical protein
LVQEAQVNGEKQADCDTHCTLSRLFIFSLFTTIVLRLALKLL